MSYLSNSFQMIFNYERCKSNVHTQQIFVEGQKSIKGQATLLLYVTENHTKKIGDCIQSHQQALLEAHQCEHMIVSYKNRHSFYRTNKNSNG